MANMYESVLAGGAAATDITPSNSTPASMSADGVYHATAAGYAIESYNSKTPSNASPVALVSGEIDKIGGNGYAIESYSAITPSDTTSVALNEGDIVKPTVNGYAIESSPTDITPSNSSPVSISSGTVYRASGNGKAVESLSSFAPSQASYASVSPNRIIRNAGNDVATFCITTPLTPSNDSPPYLMGNLIYKFADEGPQSGYAIQSFQSKTPAPTGVAFDAGFVKMSSAGYASTSPHGYTAYSNILADVSTASSAHTISDKKDAILLVLLFYQAGSATAYNRLDGATCSGGTISKITNLRQTNGNAYGTFYLVKPTSDSCVITAPYSCFAQVFEAL